MGNRKNKIEILRKILPEKWVCQPYELTFLKGGMSMMQLNIFVTLVESIQEVVNTALSNKDVCIFSDDKFDEDGVLKIAIPYRNIVENCHYSEIKKAADKLYELSAIRTTVYPDGSELILKSHLFKSVGEYTNHNLNNQKEVVFVLEKEMAEKVFNLRRYTKYLSNIARSFNSVYTARLYMYISYYKHYKKWSVDYIRLREYLGLRVCLENVENKHLEWVEKKYLDFYDFEKCILKVSMEGMDILAKQNQIDCFFDYHVENKLVSSRMTRKIIFNIKLTDYGKRQLESNNTKKLHHKFKNILKKEFELQPNDVKYIDQIYTDENAELFIHKLHVIKDDVLSRKDVIVSLKKYIFSILETTLDNKDTDDDNKNVVDADFEEIKNEDVPKLAEQNTSTEKQLNIKGCYLKDNPQAKVVSPKYEVSKKNKEKVQPMHRNKHNSSVGPTVVTKTIDIEDCIKIASEDERWLIKVCESFPLSLEKLHALLKNFNDEQICNGKTDYVSMQDFKTHFVNWYRKIKKQENDEINEHESQPVTPRNNLPRSVYGQNVSRTYRNRPTIIDVNHRQEDFAESF